MATINDLYLKYTNKVGRTLESDRYFQYLFEMIQAGDNELQQTYQIMHKVVDERWLETIEGCLDSINTIIEKPRRFVTTKEEVVPVALARKITADSVRHLSMNTQFIASSENGDIQPTRVLNVSTEESYNLYENRFIYHLIQRLMTFIDKRTDVIFWITGDETQNVLTYQSKVDDAYEEIEYQIRMKIKNRQSLAENEADNMNVFMRIDRVRRMVLTLKHSAFCSIMAGCSKVRSPIQRTNLIMKDPDYRKCYQLWQFLENYDEVGYTIEVQDKALEFDEEYLIQMYTNLITNYTVFKSLIPDDSRKLNEGVLTQKKRVIKPKFIKKIKEEFVDDPNIEDVEIRQVFVKEVTQAQLDAEAALAEEIETRKKAEQALEDMDAQMISLQQQVSNLMMQNQEAEVRAEEEREGREAAQKQLEEEQQARAVAEESAVAARQDAETQIIAMRQQTDSEIAETKRKAENWVGEIRQDAEAQIAAAKQDAETRIAETQENAENRVIAMRQQADREIEEAKRSAEDQVTSMRQQADREIAEVKADAETQIAMIRRKTDDEITLTKENADHEIQSAAQRVREARQQIKDAAEDAERRIADTMQQLNDTKAQADSRIQQLQTEMEDARKKADVDISALIQEKKQLEQESDRARAEMEAQVQQTQAELQKCLEKAEADRKEAEEQEQRLQERIASMERREENLKQRLADSNRSWEEMEKRLEQTEHQMEEARNRAIAAEEKAAANTLSHYLLSKISGKKRRGKDSEDGDGS